MKVLWLLLILTLTLCAKEVNLLNNASIYVDDNHITFNDIRSLPFEKLSTDHINYGFSTKRSVWIRFELTNDTNETLDAVIEVNNPLLEHITLYDANGNNSARGMLHVNKEQTAINPSFEVTLPPQSRELYHLHVINTTTSLQFSVILTDAKNFNANDTKKQLFLTVLIGIISAFLIYSLALFFYSRDISYFYYALYIGTLLFQQLTYSGFLPLYMPQSFTHIDNLIVVPKLAMMIIAATYFARSFLKTAAYKTVDSIYKFFIIISIVQILLLSTPWFYYPVPMILTGLLFICFNFFAGIYVYNRGNKQARFFIAGWTILITGYLLLIFDALGIYSVMYHFPYLILFCTVFEALFLLLAFVDKINLLQQQKESSERELFEILQQRNSVIEQEVQTRTAALKNLYKELHHRVKNNLQIILSIIRLQGDRIDNSELKLPFLELENRINSIAKTHELLYQNEDIETIDMSEYIESLCDDIEASLSKKDLKFVIDVNAQMALREAVYVGLIVNELVSNAIKYANTGSTVVISLHHSDEESYHLHVSDNGEGYKGLEASTSSLGLKLVTTLVQEQLGGTLTIHHNDECTYDIRFKT